MVHLCYSIFLHFCSKCETIKWIIDVFHLFFVMNDLSFPIRWISFKTRHFFRNEKHWYAFYFSVNWKWALFIFFWFHSKYKHFSPNWISDNHLKSNIWIIKMVKNGSKHGFAWIVIEILGFNNIPCRHCFCR